MRFIVFKDKGQTEERLHAVQWKEKLKPGETKYRGYITQDSALKLFTSYLKKKKRL